MNNINILCQYKNWIFALKVPVWNYLLGKKYIVDFFLVFNVKTFFLYYFSPEQISLFINFLGAIFFIDFSGFIHLLKEQVENISFNIISREEKVYRSCIHERFYYYSDKTAIPGIGQHKTIKLNKNSALKQVNIGGQMVENLFIGQFITCTSDANFQSIIFNDRITYFTRPHWAARTSIYRSLSYSYSIYHFPANTNNVINQRGKNHETYT